MKHYEHFMKHYERWYDTFYEPRILCNFIKFRKHTNNLEFIKKSYNCS